jgi:hypothetical protein
MILAHSNVISRIDLNCQKDFKKIKMARNRQNMKWGPK